MPRFKKYVFYLELTHDHDAYLAGSENGREHPAPIVQPASIEEQVRASLLILNAD